jgi:hypothetical protein
MIENA